jgi:Domain of unknown function (DUF4410)
MAVSANNWSRSSAACAMVLALLLSACSSAKIVAEQDVSRGTRYRPAVIYVADFQIRADAIRSESRFSQFSRHARREEAKAVSLVDRLSDAIVSDLEAKGLDARRLPKGAQLPRQGWLVRGAFLDIDEGSRVRRSIIGFGAGQTDLQLAVAVDNLSTGTAAVPLYQVQAAAESGKGPGAVVTLNPYVAAAKFVMAGHDLDRNAEQSASKIVDDIVARVNSAS